ncbi:Retrieval of early ER protein Rer1 [Cynara cardunculus var. scolymus]|uniref:Retrieval of early ER protein Rer1 n=1 Tax=Cynara cardunculus var. scolymus TaxID=59895 RepID=A0A124SDY2_CYNCS|nr:Retrieval of early ER protein Rer1 [Cynara cardunculus var. scolymus]
MNIIVQEGKGLVYMEGVEGDTASPVAPLAKWRNEFSRAFQYYLDKSTPLPVHRWLGTLAVAAVYILRVYYLRGFYIISYGLGIYTLNLLIGFLSPKVDPELEGLDGASLPTKGSDEFRPFIRRVPEFKFWYAITKAFIVAFCLTFLSVLDVPVFWPILLCYWIVLFVLTMKHQIMHMIKYKYVPFNIGKQARTAKILPFCAYNQIDFHLSLVLTKTIFLNSDRHMVEKNHLEVAEGTEELKKLAEDMKMVGRTFLVILFFWAALTIVTPILVRMSSSTSVLDYNDELDKGGPQRSRGMSFLPRRTLVSTEHPFAPAPAPAPAPCPPKRLVMQRYSSSSRKKL